MNKNIEPAKIILNVCVFMIFIIVIYLCKPNFYAFTSPDENSIYNFAISDSKFLGKITFKENIPSNPYKIASRGTSVMQDGSLISTKFYGFSYILKSFYEFGNKNIEIISIISFIVLLLILYFFIFLLTKNLILTAISMIIILTNPSLSYWYCKGFMEDIPAIFLIFLGLYLIIKYNKQIKYINCAFLFFGLAVFIKPLYFIYIVPCFIYILYNKNYKNLFYSILFFLIYFFLLLYINYIIFGSPFTTGPSVVYSSSGTFAMTDQSIVERFININKGIISIFTVYPPIIIAGLISIVNLIRKKSVELNFYYLASSIVMIIYLFGFSGAQLATNITISVCRYLLFIQIFSIIIIFYNLGIEYLHGKGVIVTFIIILSFLSYSYNFKYIDELNASKRESFNLNKLFYEFFNNNKLNIDKTILITDGFDKIFFPKIKTVIINEKFAKNVYKDNSFLTCNVIKYYLNLNYSILLFGYNFNVDIKNNCFNSIKSKILEDKISGYKIWLITN